MKTLSGKKLFGFSIFLVLITCDARANDLFKKAAKISWSLLNSRTPFRAASRWPVSSMLPLYSAKLKVINAFDAGITSGKIFPAGPRLELTHDGIRPATYIKQMREWWKLYTSDEKFQVIYDQHRMALAAEATFWAVELGFDRIVEGWSPSQFASFLPFLVDRDTALGKAILSLQLKLLLPCTEDETRVAVQDAIEAIFVHTHGFDVYIKAIEDNDKHELDFMERFHSHIWE